MKIKIWKDGKWIHGVIQGNEVKFGGVLVPLTDDGMIREGNSLYRLFDESFTGFPVFPVMKI